MWLSKQMSKFIDDKSKASLAEITRSDNAMVNVQKDIEHREVSIISPLGIAYSPKLEQNAVVMQVDDLNYCIGVKMPDKNLNPGDLLLYSDKASISIKSDGSIEINGDVKINGVSVENLNTD